MRTVKLLCWQVYEWNKADFWLINILSVLSGLFLHFYEIHSVFQALLIICLFVKVFTYMRGASVMPALGADTHQFSWKYMQSMPLNKKEIVVFFMLTNLMAFLPLWVWFASFQPLLFNLFDIKMNGFSSVIKLHVFILITFFLLTPTTLTNLIQFPRQQFSRKNEKAYFYETLKKMLVWTCGLIYFICTVYFFDIEYDINLLSPVFRILEFIINCVTALQLHKMNIDWSSLGILGEVFLLFMMSRGVIKIWQNESLSYVKINWNAKRDMPVMAGCLILITLPFQFNFMGVEEYYRKDPLLKSAYLGDLPGMKKLLRPDSNINLTNKYGATILMAAAENGDLENFKFLERLGASRTGKLKFKKTPERDVYELAVERRHFAIAEHLLNTGYIPKKTALLDVASRCNTKLNDLLVEKGADLKAVNVNGESVLHIAAKSNCFASVVSLIELGADLELKDKSGKLAYDYIDTKDSDLAYYLAKKNRSPAGK